MTIRDNARFQWHPMTPPHRLQMHPPLIITQGEGVYVTDIDGRRYVDAVGGLWCVNVGHNRTEVKQAIAAQLDQIAYYSSFDGTTTPPSIALSRRIVEMTGEEDMARVMFSSGGSDAVETALKLARQYWKLVGEPERTKFISLRQAYHGVHFGGASVNGNEAFRWAYEPLMPGCFQVDTPWLYRNPWTDDPDELAGICADILDREIAYQGAHTVAAFIAEPVQGAGGVIVPPDRYWPLVREVCDRHGVLLIADEVVTGFGRTGSMFGARGWGVKPDIMCLAKGLSSGYAPLGATVFNRRIENAWAQNMGFEAAIMHGYTYSGHPVACAAALACLDIVETEDLPANAVRQGKRLLDGLKPFAERFPHVGEVRGKGLMVAIDLVTDKRTREPVNPADGYAYRVAELVREHGVIVRPVGTKLILSPPLVIDHEAIDHTVSALEQGFTAADA
ncbi:MAG: aminotransferase class III-fold pyridoxal phosphate-dependent enzyme [Sphingomonadales bacterium]